MLGGSLPLVPGMLHGTEYIVVCRCQTADEHAALQNRPSCPPDTSLHPPK